MGSDLREIVSLLSTTADKTVFSVAARNLEAIKRNINWSNISGPALGLISEADKIVFSRVRKRAWCMRLKGLSTFPVLAVGLSLAPIVSALFIAFVAWVSADFNPFDAYAIVFLAMYSARFVHEMGHWLFMRRIAVPVAIYGSPFFITIRMQVRYLSEQVSLSELVRLYGGGSVANLAVAVIIILALITKNVAPPLIVLAIILANLAAGVFNLIPFGKGTDGSMLLRIFRNQ